MPDLILAGGHVIDPVGGHSGRRSLIFSSGVVATATRDVESTTVDASECWVIPGMVDLHGHFFRGGFPFGLAPDIHAEQSGVIAMADAGSAGWANLPAFREAVIARSKTRVYAFVNVSAIGLVPRAVGLGELSDARYADPVGLEAAIRAGGPEVIGVKVRMTLEAGPPDVLRVALQRAREVCDDTGVRMMVHVCGSPVPLAEVLQSLRAGDVLSHYLHDGENGILGPGDAIRDEVLDATRRGVLLEVGHGGIHVDHHVAEVAASHGLWPDIISTDAHRAPPERDVPSMTETMSLFLHLGMPAERVVQAATSTPTEVIGDPSLSASLAFGIGRHATVLEASGPPRVFRDRKQRPIRVDSTLRIRDRVVDGVLVVPEEVADADAGSFPGPLFDSVAGHNA